MRIVVIPAESEPFEKHIPDADGAQLEALQKIVGGYVQTFLMPKYPRCVMLAREEQAEGNRTPNEQAERLTGFSLVGTVVVAGQAPPNLVDIPAEIIKELGRA